MNFGQALERLKANASRAKGKGMWLIFIPADRWSTSANWSSDAQAAAPTHRKPWIAMKTADGGLVPWLASQTDLLAEDWSQVS